MLEIEKIIPQNGRILVQAKKQEEKTASGLLLPGKVEQKFKTATVLAVGTGENKDGTRYLVNYEVGQEIIFGAFAGTTLCEENGYILLNEEEVYATIKQ